MDSEQRKN